MPLEMNYKEVAACTETAFSLILGCRGVINHAPTASEGTGAHHREGDAKRAAEAARKHPRASVMVCLGCHSRLVGNLSSLAEDTGRACMENMERHLNY